jgi:hypothetical protein
MSDFQSLADLLGSLKRKRPQLLPVSSNAMSPDDILHWGERHNWPRLVLDGDVLRAGRDAWEEMATGNDYVRLVAVSERIAKWNKLEQGE